MTAQDRGWGPPCQSDKIRTLVRSDGLRLPVRTETLEMTRVLCDRTEQLGYDLKPGWCWGYACRKVSGSGNWSNHAWGLAVDLNAPVNPYASADWHRRNARGTFPFGLRLVCDMPESMISMWEDAGYRWGGRYKNKPDPMHFEYMGTPAQAAKMTAALTGGDDDMSAEAEKQIAQIHKAIFDGSPSVGVHSIVDSTNKTIYNLAGIGENTIRHFIQDQDRRTRELTAAGLTRLWEQIEAAIGAGGGGPVNVSPADRNLIAKAVIDLMSDRLET